MAKTILKNKNRIRRRARIRSQVSGSADRPRLSVFKSNRYLYAQLIDDASGVTLAAVDSRNTPGDLSLIHISEPTRPY